MKEKRVWTQSELDIKDCLVNVAKRNASPRSTAALSEHIYIEPHRDHEDVLKLTLLRTSCNANMQTDRAAFEGWAAVVHQYYGQFRKIELDVDDVDSLPGGQGPFRSKHYGRFLYRALRFQQQFPDWFCLSPKLEQRVTVFEQYLLDGKFCNNLPGSEPDKAGKHKAEREAEVRLHRHPEMLRELLREQAGITVGDDGVFHRQLHVGLFDTTGRNRKNLTSKANQVFAGGNGAIDLWGIHEDTLLLFELKTTGNKPNKKIGCIPELFFYANYMYDMFVDQTSTFHPQELKAAEDKTGYQLLYDRMEQKKLKRIQAFLLTDPNSLHPLLADEKKAVLSLLNREDGSITYDRIIYDKEKLFSL